MVDFENKKQSGEDHQKENTCSRSGYWRRNWKQWNFHKSQISTPQLKKINIQTAVQKMTAWKGG